MVAHSALTGSNLHEPKGVASATAGTVYLADGAGSGSWTALLPIGSVIFFAGSSLPSRFLFVYGQDVSRTTYAGLFTALGTTYGSGDGSTTFGLPDIRGRVIAGQDDMGGTSADRLTSPLNGDTLGAAGGTETHSHTYSGTTSGPNLSAGGFAFGGGGVASATNHSHTYSGTTAEGSSVQPTIILNAIIYTGVA